MTNKNINARMMVIIFVMKLLRARMLPVSMTYVEWRMPSGKIIMINPWAPKKKNMVKK